MRMVSTTAVRSHHRTPRPQILSHSIPRDIFRKMTARLNTAVIAAKKLHHTLQHWSCILWHSIPKDVRCSVSHMTSSPHLHIPRTIEKPVRAGGFPQCCFHQMIRRSPQSQRIAPFLHPPHASGRCGAAAPSSVPHSSAARGAPNPALHPTVLCPFGCSCSTSTCPPLPPPRTPPHHRDKNTSAAAAHLVLGQDWETATRN